jgi:hypothetical protein
MFQKGLLSLIEYSVVILNFVGLLEQFEGPVDCSEWSETKNNIVELIYSFFSIIWIKGRKRTDLNYAQQVCNMR